MIYLVFEPNENFYYILVFPLIFAIICGFIAKGKYRHFIGWFIFGFCFGIIALIVLLCQKDKPGKPIKKPITKKQEVPKEKTENDILKHLASINSLYNEGKISKEKYESARDAILFELKLLKDKENNINNK